MAALLLTACSSEDAPDTASEQTLWRVSIPVEESATRGVYSDDDGATLKSKWVASQPVVAYNSSDDEVGPSLTASANATGGTTTITGDISGTYTAGTSTLTLYSPARLTSATHAEYAVQDGTIEGISAKDYVTADVTVTAVDADNGLLTTSTATFQRLQSFTKFTFSVPVQTVVISATGMAPITVTASADKTVFYVALPLEGSVDYTFTCTDDDGNIYRGTKTGVLTHGKYYSSASVTIVSGVVFTNISSWGDGDTVSPTIDVVTI